MAKPMGIRPTSPCSPWRPGRGCRQRDPRGAARAPRSPGRTTRTTTKRRRRGRRRRRRRGRGDDENEEDEEEEEEDQPPVTAGGLFTRESYPRRELFRPLTMTEKVTEAQAPASASTSARRPRSRAWACSRRGPLRPARTTSSCRATFGSSVQLQAACRDRGRHRGRAGVRLHRLPRRAAASTGPAVIDPMTLEIRARAT
jgi:hypothetical protein